MRSGGNLLFWIGVIGAVASFFFPVTSGYSSSLLGGGEVANFDAIAIRAMLETCFAGLTIAGAVLLAGGVIEETLIELAKGAGKTVEAAGPVPPSE